METQTFSNSFTKFKIGSKLQLILFFALIVPIALAERNLTGRELSSTQVCIAYQDAAKKICSQCNEGLGYQIVIVNSTNAVCGTVSGTSVGSTCTVPSSLWPDVAALPGLRNSQFTLQPLAYPSVKAYCYSQAIYYGVSCNSYSAVAGVTYPSIYTTIFAQTTSACYSCSYDFSNQVVQTFQSSQVSFASCQLPIYYQGGLYSCGYDQYFDQGQKSCTSCSSKYANCASCNSTGCLLCETGYYYQPNFFNYSTGTTQGVCILDTCPLGYCQAASINSCVPSSLTGCNRCSSSVSSSTESQTCEECAGGYRLTGSETCQLRSGILSQTLYVKSGVLLSTTDTNSEQNGLTPGTASPFILSVINNNIDSMESQGYSSASLNILVGKGNHFMFACTGDESQSYLQGNSYGFTDFCSTFNLHLKNPQTDAITITLQTMFCDLASSLGLTGSDLTAFNLLCVTKGTDPLPTVYVNNAFSYFNITGSLTVQNLVFSGINQMAFNNESLDLSVLPVQLCDVSKAPSPSDGLLQLENLTNNEPLEYECIDSNYQGSTLASSLLSQSCSQSEYSSQLQNQQLNCRIGPQINPLAYFFMDDATNSYSQRRRTLFNLYSLPDHLSTLYQPPSLTITNCTFTYFLSGYQSLIHIENDNLNKQTLNTLGDGVTYTIYSYNGGERGAIIQIKNTTFTNSRFCVGLIYYRSQTYLWNTLGFINYTHLYMTNPTVQSGSSMISIQNSSFQNLNILNNLTALLLTSVQPIAIPSLQGETQLEQIAVPLAMHKGIVLNLDSFPGSIFIDNSQFKQNSWFISDVLNGPYNPTSALADTWSNYFYDSSYFLTKICNSQNIYQYVFGSLVTNQQAQSWMSQVERIGMVSIKVWEKGQIVISNSNFSDNLGGILGGAVTITYDSRSSGLVTPVILYNNTFLRNMAYVGGNAIQINGSTVSCGRGTIFQQNNFTNNIGTKVQVGGTISIQCSQTQPAASTITSLVQQTVTSPLNGLSFAVDSTKTNVTNNWFQENYSGGQSGAALTINFPENVALKNNTFLRNGPVYKNIETLLSPYYKIANQTSFTLNSDSSMTDELDFILNYQQNYQGQTIDWPRMYGAVYLQYCSTLSCLAQQTQVANITNCTFTNNQVGPALDTSLSSQNQLTSSLRIDGGESILIQTSNFTDANGTQNTNYFSRNVTQTLGSILPNQTYFNRSSGVHISISQSVISDVSNGLTPMFNVTLFKTKFMRNQGIAPLGIPALMNQQLASLISYSSNYGTVDYASNGYPLLQIINSTFIDNSFIGFNTSLILANNCQLKFINNTVNNSGIYSRAQDQVMAFTSGQYLSSYILRMQQAAIVTISNSLTQAGYPIPNYMLSYIQSNYYSYLFNTSATRLLTGGFGDVSLSGNTYNYLIGQAVGLILNVNPWSSLTSFIEIPGYNYTSNIQLQQESPLMIWGQAIYFSGLSINSQVVLALRDVTFTDSRNNSGAVIQASQFGFIYMSNVIVNHNAQYMKNYSTVFFKQYQVLDTGYNLSTYISAADQKVLTGSQQPYELLVNLALSSVAPSSYRLITINGVFIVDNNNTNSSNVIIEDCQFYNSYYDQTQFMYLQNVNASITSDNLNSFIFSNTILPTTMAGSYERFTPNPIEIQSSTVVMINLLFTDNTATGADSFIHSYNSVLQMISVTFDTNVLQNSQRSQTSTNMQLLSIEGGKYYCQFCVWNDNNASDTMIEVYNVGDPTTSSSGFTLSSCTFTDNSAALSLIDFMTSAFEFDTLTFQDNYCTSINNGINMIKSQGIADSLTVDNSDSIQNDQVSVGFFSLNLGSSLLITNSEFSKVTGALAALALISGQSSFDIESSTVKNIDGTKSLNVILAQSANSLTVSSDFINCSATSISTIQTTVQVSSSNFINQTSSQAIFGQLSSISITTSNFTNGYSPTVSGAAITCVNCPSLIVKSSLFTNSTAQAGGAIYFQGQDLTSIFQILLSNFTLNQAQLGGALYIQNGGQMSIRNSTFLSNNASSKSSITQALGGAIYYDCTPKIVTINSTQCLLRVMFSNFTNNSAMYEGGVIAQVGTATFLDGPDNLYVNNSAAYGNIQGTSPSSLVFDFKSINSTQRRILTTSSTPVTFPQIVSGQPFSFNIYIMDTQGNIYTADSSSIALLQSASSLVSVTNGMAIANKGTFSFINTTVIVTPGASASLSLNFISSTLNSVTSSSGSPMSAPISLTMSTRDCIAGEVQTSNAGCLKCPNGQYLYETLIANGTAFCQNCLPNSICFGGSNVAPAMGYWRSSNTSEVFVECPNSFACLGGDINTPTGTCASGYQGVLCAECQTGYTHSDNAYTCVKCPTPSATKIGVALLLVLWILVVFIFIGTALSSGNHKLTIYFRLIADHFQMMTVLATIDYAYGWSLANNLLMYEFGLNEIAKITQELYSLDCLLQQVPITTNVPVFYQRLVFYSLLPIVLGIIIFSYWCFLKTLLAIRAKKLTAFWAKLICSLLIALQLVHPGISRAAFQAFQCLSFQDPPQSRLVLDLSQVCHTGQHKTYAYGAGIPSILIWATGIPIATYLAIYLSIRKKPIKLAHDPNTSQRLPQQRPTPESKLSGTIDLLQTRDLTLTIQDIIEQEDQISSVGFFTSGYQSKYKYWEVYLMVRKVALILSASQLSQVSAEMQINTCSMIVIMSLILQLTYKPYDNLQLNRLAEFSIGIQIITLYTAMYYASGRHYDYMNGRGVQVFFMIVLIIPQALYIIYWTYLVRLDLLKLAYKLNKPKLFRFLSFYQYSMTSFANTHLNSNETQSLFTPVNKSIKDLTFDISMSEKTERILVTKKPSKDEVEQDKAVDDGEERKETSTFNVGQNPNENNLDNEFRSRDIDTLIKEFTSVGITDKKQKDSQSILKQNTKNVTKIFISPQRKIFPEEKLEQSNLQMTQDISEIQRDGTDHKLLNLDNSFALQLDTTMQLNASHLNQTPDTLLPPNNEEKKVQFQLEEQELVRSEESEKVPDLASKTLYNSGFRPTDLFSPTHGHEE